MGSRPSTPADEVNIVVAENRWWLSGRYAGPHDCAQTYPLLGPWFAAPGGGSSSQESVNLDDVPSGAACKVSISRGSSPVKGSSTAYAVH
ncbi:MAG TPA: hypothetical protein VFI44_09560 [Ornithinibacter sp.]|nr:hypothetical protein [Ornithinibacter sp.]